MSSARKWHKIDLIMFISRCTYKEWNKYLDHCVEFRNVTSLASTYYGLQVGLQYAIFQKLADDFVIQTFINLQRSATKALRKIYLMMFNKTCFDPLITPEFKDIISKVSHRDFIFEKFFPGVYI